MFNKLFRKILKKNKSNLLYKRLERMSEYFNEDTFNTALGLRKVKINTSNYPYTTISLVYYDYDDKRLFGIACDKDWSVFLPFKSITENKAKLALYEIENILGETLKHGF